jgi:hypothetical protein
MDEAKGKSPGGFKKGNPGGPGRPRGSGRIDLGGWSDDVGFPLLKRIAEGKAGAQFSSWKARIRAIELLLAYEKGRPIQSSDGPPDAARSVAELIRDALARGVGGQGAGGAVVG